MEDQSANYLGPLCKIQLSEEEKKSLGQNLQKVLKYMALLDELDVTNLPPCTNVIETMINVMEEDEEKLTVDRKAIFDNFPDRVGNMLKVPPVISFEE